ncbi:MAG: lysophospholipid acyltransferase family protein [Chloroflexota bacterium]
MAHPVEIAAGQKMNLRYRTMRRIFAWVYRLLMRIEVTGLENFEVAGPCLVVVNHLSVFDPPLLQILYPRRAVAFAADKYRRHPVFSPIMGLIGNVIYIRRGEIDRQALRAALEVLRAGGTMGLAPEGTRSKIGQLQRAREGAAYLASRTDATIVPVGISGTETVLSNLKRLRRSRVRAVVGQPFKLPPVDGPVKGAQLAANTDRIMCRIAALLPESYRGYYRHRCASDGAPLPADT